ncbi:MAG: glycosyltransferase involved in cell wall biosynthesis [Candidatus Latescibacterota bacterium]|jgi:glycosyltransferase involved in cell wall biosynthesis
MDVTIVIRARNEASSIGKVLDAIATQSFDGEIETILVDTESTDGTADIARDKQARVVPITRNVFTWGHALNLGAEAGSGQFIVNLSAHAVPSNEHWLTHLIHPLKEDESVAGVFGRQLAIDNADPFEAVELKLWFPDWPAPRPSTSFSNANGALRRSLWEKYPFDEAVMIGEDTVWAKQVLQHGYQTVYQPLGQVFHNHDLDVHSKESTNSIFVRWYWRSYVAAEFTDNYRGADVRYALSGFRNYARRSLTHLHEAGLLAQACKIPIYESIRQYASWLGARDYQRGYLPKGRTWIDRYFAPQPPVVLRILGALL